jgi:hypothetical protein
VARIESAHWGGPNGLEHESEGEVDASVRRCSHARSRPLYKAKWPAQGRSTDAEQAPPKRAATSHREVMPPREEGVALWSRPLRRGPLPVALRATVLSRQETVVAATTTWTNEISAQRTEGKKKGRAHLVSHR